MPFAPARSLGLLIAGIAATCLLGGCNAGNLKQSLTTPPPVSSAAGQQGSGAAAAPGSTTSSVNAAAATPNGGAPASAAHAATSSRRSASRRRTKVAAAPGAGPASPPARQKGTAKQNAPFVEQGAATTGVYPKFVPPKAATTEMTDAEKKKFEEMMAARLKANQPPAETPAEAAEREKLLKALAARHGPDTLKAIENQ